MFLAVWVGFWLLLWVVVWFDFVVGLSACGGWLVWIVWLCLLRGCLAYGLLSMWVLLC